MLRQKVLSASLPYEAKLLRYRTKSINAIAKQLKNYPQNEWVEYVKAELNEPYLRGWFRDMYLSAGQPAGDRAVRNFLNIKNDGLNIWEKALFDWIYSQLGNKITLVNGSLKGWVIDTIEQYIEQHHTEGVEKIVQGVEKAIRDKWHEARQWQIRRIVQTESLTAMSEAADVAIKSLGIKYSKTWGISGNNTRPAHAEMDGITIGQNDLFLVDNELLEFPRDSKHGASAGNIINCRCYCIRKPLNDRGQLITDEDILAMV